MKQLLLQTITLLAITVVRTSGIHAQRKFEGGKIIPYEGDTLKGLIIINNPMKAAFVCEFKSTEDEEYIVYTPERLAGYMMNNGRVYKTQKFKNDSGDSVAVFMQVLVVGNTSLFSFYDPESSQENRYFIKKGDGGLAELTGSQNVVRKGDIYQSKGNFKQILKSVMADCAKIQAQIERSTLIQSSLTALIHTYNNCMGDKQSEVVYNKTKSANTFNYGPRVGMSIGQTVHTTSGAATSFILGAFTELHLNELSKRLSVQAEVVFNTNQEYTFKPNYAFSNQIRFSSLQVPLLVKYDLLKSKFAPYVQGGLAAMVLYDFT